MNRIKKFVSNLLRDIFTDEDKHELIEILTTSLEEKVDDLVEQGTPREEAIDKSIKEFGEAHDVLEAFPHKSALRQRQAKNRKKQFLFSLIAYLLICGIAIFLNLSLLDFFNGFNWYVIVIIGVFFWPLVMLYRYWIVNR